MRLIRRNVHFPYKEEFKCVAAIGNFDGMHLGHQAVIRQLQKQAKETELLAMVITFEPMPSEFFLKEKAPKRLMKFREKFEMLQELGVDVMCILSFNAGMASLSPEEFIHNILVEGLNVQHLVVGDDFKFGKNRKGDIEFLKKQGKSLGFLVTVVPICLLENEKVSSTRIREALAQGKANEAESLLGRKV